ncbi:MAG TPA: type III-A CRISPR-associated RAMP protein Csm5 [Candidatus Atribacteria bacterium]|nr:type III-A CRISPR-associated RAMP protein Csm5 [Candidatus Atribacteria bacterium]
MKYQIETLSPIHIGNGEKISPMEYVIDSRFNRIDMDELFRDKEFNVNGFIDDVNFGSFYLGERYGGIAKKHVLYSLEISKDATNYMMDKRSEVQEFIKTGGRPYIPSSSIKGAIRTAIMWYALKNDSEIYFELENYINKIWDRTEIKPNKKWVGSRIERMIFGKDPNHDLLRVLRISDADRISLNNLDIKEVKILSTTRSDYYYKGYSSIVESLKRGIKTCISIKIDNFLVKEKENLKFNDAMIKYIHSFADICNEYAKDLIKYELSFFTRYNDGRLNQIIDFYEGLYDEIENGILLRLAWGTGWHGMTVGRLLEEDILDRLRRLYNLGRRRNKPDFVKPFPKTRKIVFENGVARYPMGWIKLEEVR